MLRATVTMLFAALLTACATVPDVTYRYYPAKSTTHVSVIQTVGCSADHTIKIALHTPAVTTTYSSDLDKTPFEIRIKDLGGWFADTDMSMALSDDGRLKAIGQSATGQGENIIKSVVTLVAAVAAMGGGGPPKPYEECTLIDKWGGGKPVTLNYKTVIFAGKSDVVLEPTKDSEALYNEIKAGLPRLEATATSAKFVDTRATYNAPPSGRSDRVVLMKLQKTAYSEVSISADGTKIGDSRIFVPTPEVFELPIPKAALFGKQSFSINVSDSGALTSVAYGTTAGAAGVMNALGSIASTQTEATKAAELKAEADIMAQQQRIVVCQTNRDECK